jgi:hypothetical protein
LNHCGNEPTITQRLLIDRLIRCTIQLDGLDKKLLGGGWTDNDARTHGALINRQRSLARELGLKGAAERPPSTAGHIARRRPRRPTDARLRHRRIHLRPRFARAVVRR